MVSLDFCIFMVCVGSFVWNVACLEDFKVRQFDNVAELFLEELSNVSLNMSMFIME